MMHCELEVHDEINPFLPGSFVRVFLSHQQKGNRESALEAAFLVITRRECKTEVVVHLRIRSSEVMSPCFKKKKEIKFKHQERVIGQI